MTVASIRRGGVLGAEIEIHGLDGLLARLERLSPEVRKAFEAELRSVVRSVGAAAGARLHPGANDSRSSYAVRARRGAFKVHNPKRGAVISEFAGRANPGGLTPRGATLIRTLNAAYGPPGRLVWQAWDERRDEVTGKVEGIVAAAEARLRGA